MDTEQGAILHNKRRLTARAVDEAPDRAHEAPWCTLASCLPRSSTRGGAKTAASITADGRANGSRTDSVCGSSCKAEGDSPPRVGSCVSACIAINLINPPGSHWRLFWRGGLSRTCRNEWKGCRTRADQTKYSYKLLRWTGRLCAKRAVFAPGSANKKRAACKIAVLSVDNTGSY